MKGFKHFFAVPPLKTPELTARGIGVQEHMPPCIIDRPRGTGDFLFMLFYDEVWIGAGESPRLHPPPTLMLWTPGRPQYYGHRGHPYNHTWIHCDGSLVRALLRRNGLPRNAPIPRADPALMERHLLATHAELTRHARPDPVIVRNHLEIWLRETARALRGEHAEPAVPGPMLAVRHYIESEYAQPISLPDLARRAHLSVPHFCAQFRRYFGTPAIEYLIRQRLHQAAYLLHDRNLNVSEIARRVGYEDLFHFSRLFKKHFGVSPRNLRKEG